MRIDDAKERTKRLVRSAPPPQNMKAAGSYDGERGDTNDLIKKRHGLLVSLTTISVIIAPSDFKFYFANRKRAKDAFMSVLGLIY